MRRRDLVRRAAPGMLMGVGSALLIGSAGPRPTTLRESLETIPLELAGYRGTPRTISSDEVQLGGMSSYLFRDYGGRAGFSLYVGYYDQQAHGRTIHSPRDCLPGSGWEPVEATNRVIAVGGREITAKRYLVAKGQHRALVYYWYQGRGRLTSNEYGAKLALLWDAALRGRTEEAVARMVFPITGPETESLADSLAARVAAELVPALERALPSAP